MTQTPPIWSAEKIVDAIFDDLRDRRFLKWLFRSEEGIIGDFQRLHSLDLEVQEEIRQAWAEIIRTSLASIPVSRRAETDKKSNTKRDYAVDEQGMYYTDRKMRYGMDCNWPECGCCHDSKCSDAPDALAASPAPLPVEEQIEPVQNMHELAGELMGFYHALDGHGPGDGRFTIQMENGEAEQTRMNLRAVLREASVAVEALSPNLALEAGDLAKAFRNVDASDWGHLFAVLPDTGRGRFWKAVMTEARAALVKP